MHEVEIPRVPDVFPRVLSEDEIKALLRAAKKPSWTGIRNYAMLLTFLDTGIRLSELISLDVKDVDLTGRTLRVRHGKGAKERHVFGGRFLLRALRSWLEVHGSTRSDEPLFVTRNGDRHDSRNVDRIVERIAVRAGLEGVRVTPHVLRHTFATHYIMNGGDPFSLQRILGHSDIKTTMIYVNLAGVGLKEAHAKASPVDRLLWRR
jgi:integrase/recombinase XerD